MTKNELLRELLRSYAVEDVGQFPKLGKLDDVFEQFLKTEPTKKDFRFFLHGIPLTAGMLWEIMHYKENSK